MQIADFELEGVLLLPGSRFGYADSHFRIGFGRLDMPPALERLDSFLQRGAQPRKRRLDGRA